MPSVKTPSIFATLLYSGNGSGTFHTVGGRVENGGKRAERLIEIKLLLDGRRVSVGTRRVA